MYIQCERNLVKCRVQYNVKIVQYPLKMYMYNDSMKVILKSTCTCEYQSELDSRFHVQYMCLHTIATVQALYIMYVYTCISICSTCREDTQRSCVCIHLLYHTVHMTT